MHGRRIPLLEEAPYEAERTPADAELNWVPFLVPLTLSFS